MAFNLMKEYANRLSIHKNYRSNEILNFINNNFSLGKGEYAFMSQIIGQANNCNGVAFPSTNYLAEKLGVSQPRIMQYKKQLEEKGLLIVKKIKCGDTYHNFYIVPTIGILKKVLETMLEAVQTGAEILKEVYDELAKKSKKAAGSFKEKFKKKPVRTEVTPDWFDEEGKKRQEQDQSNKHKTDNMSADEKRTDINKIFKEMGIKWKG